MRARFHTVLPAALVATVLLAASALAQSNTMPNPTPDSPNAEHWVEPPDKLPSVRQDNRSKRLDLLFEALKAAPDDDTAKAIEVRIWATWMVSKSDTANLLMGRVRKAVEDKDLKLAVKLLDAIVKIKPGFIEAWNQRATIHFRERRYGRAIADIGQVLKREPRHFGALSGLGLIYKDIGDDAEALEAFRHALKVHPRLKRIPDLVKELSVEVEGRDI